MYLDFAFLSMQPGISCINTNILYATGFALYRICLWKCLILLKNVLSVYIFVKRT